MRVAVTTIAKNEEDHVERWANSARDADCLFVLDTGSVDNTVDALRDCNVGVDVARIDPWRFDTARNVGLDLIPQWVDFVITLDMDEVLQPGWRNALENAPSADQYNYDYHWSDEVFFYGDRCFRRNAFYWKYPVHEVITPKGFVPNVQYGGFSIVHHADDSKSRDSYLPLLEVAVTESPTDDRLSHYYARELYFRGRWAKSREEFVKHLSLSSWPAERAQSYRYLAKMDDYPERWILRAIAETPNRREPWVDLILHYKQLGLPVDSLVARALTITSRPVDYMTEGRVWNDEYLRSLSG